MKFGKEVYLIAGICAVGILLIFGLSWKADPNLKGLPLIPSWLYNWTDSYGNSRIRTAVPFVFLSLLIGAWFWIRNVPAYYFVVAWGVLTAVVVLAELGQYFIPMRDVDLKDMFWGSAGSFFGLGTMYLVKRAARFIK